MQEGFIEHATGKVYFTITGQGHRTLLLFHGFGESRHAFIPLVTPLNETHKVVVFDLYFHGQSQWFDPARPVLLEDWKTTLNTFLQQYDITKFDLYGYSIGARFALATLQLFPDRIGHVFLVAPDGIHENFWYRLATRTALTRSIFRSLIKGPAPFSLLLHLMRQLRMLDPGMLRFVSNQMDTREKRARVYHCWVAFRRLRFDAAALAQVINRHHLSLTIICGRYDPIVPPERLVDFSRSLNYGKLKVFDTGHNRLVHNSIDYVKTMVK
jgi:pimeloyl-ACP methyl ester carboxylesterase